MKIQWLIFAIVAAIALALWIALGFCLIFDVKPALPVWAGLVGATALMSEVTLWTAAAAFGFSFLAKRRAVLQRWFGLGRKRDDAAV